MFIFSCFIIHNKSVCLFDVLLFLLLYSLCLFLYVLQQLHKFFFVYYKKYIIFFIIKQTCLIFSAQVPAPPAPAACSGRRRGRGASAAPCQQPPRGGSSGRPRHRAPWGVGVSEFKNLIFRSCTNFFFRMSILSESSL